METLHDPVVKSIAEMLETLSTLSTECTIYRVPPMLRKQNTEAYTCRLVSIGPFHHGKENIQGMQEHKLRYLQAYMCQTNLSLTDCVIAVRAMEHRARNSYAEKTISLSSDEFVKMLLLDGSFIIELLLKSYYQGLRDKYDPIFSRPRLIDDVCRDMILLENQLPFFVVDGMFNLLPVPLREGSPSIVDILYEHLKCFLPIYKFHDVVLHTEPEHFVSFLQSCFSPSSPREKNQELRKLHFPPTATELHNAGVKFRIGTSSSNPLDITFTNGVLEIPRLTIDDTTEILYRNLIAFEQCHSLDRYVIHYMILLTSLINSTRDADLLIKHKIIINMIGNGEDVSRLFNCILKEVNYGQDFCFSSLCEDLNAYCNIPWNKWKATLRRDYFHSPWSTVSVLAAIMLLLLTFVQALSSIKTL